MARSRHRGHDPHLTPDHPTRRTERHSVRTRHRSPLAETGPLAVSSIEDPAGLPLVRHLGAVHLRQHLTSRQSAQIAGRTTHRRPLDHQRSRLSRRRQRRDRRRRRRARRRSRCRSRLRGSGWLWGRRWLWGQVGLPLGVRRHHHRLAIHAAARQHQDVSHLVTRAVGLGVPAREVVTGAGRVSRHARASRLQGFCDPRSASARNRRRYVVLTYVDRAATGGGHARTRRWRVADSPPPPHVRPRSIPGRGRRVP